MTEKKKQGQRPESPIEPRTEAGRALLDRGGLGVRDWLSNAILAIEAEAAQGAAPGEKWVSDTIGEPGMYEGAAPLTEEYVDALVRRVADEHYRAGVKEGRRLRK